MLMFLPYKKLMLVLPFNYHARTLGTSMSTPLCTMRAATPVACWWYCAAVGSNWLALCPLCYGQVVSWPSKSFGPKCNA
eukprot:1818680-Amphidinium_carterae.1